MDQLTAHLERGWELANAGETTQASTCARTALELDPECPEAHHLLGYLHVLEGSWEDAVEAYGQAYFYDEMFISAMLSAAEIHLMPLGDAQEAIAICDQVLHLSEDEEELLEARMLRCQALVSEGNETEARAEVKRLPAEPVADSGRNHLMGRVCLELGQLELAERFLVASLETEPQNADAHYDYGLLLDQLGRDHESRIALLMCRQLELEMGLPIWAPTPEQLQKTTKAALLEVSGPAKELLARAEVYVADMPGPELVADGFDPHASALADLVKQDTAASAGVRVFLYAANLIRSAGRLEDLEQTITEAVQTELEMLLEDLVESDDAGYDHLLPSKQPKSMAATV